MATIVEKVQALETGITSVKDDLKTALTGKGVTVSDNLKLKDYPELINNITVGSGGSSTYYKCVSVKRSTRQWTGINIETGEQVVLNYTVEPEKGYIYDSTGKVYVAEPRRDLGFSIYRRRTSSGDMGGYNLNLIDYYDSNSSYYFSKIANRRFKDYCVLSESYALVIDYNGNLYSWGSYSWGDCISGIGGALSNPNPNRTTYQPRLVDESGNWERLYCIYQNTWAMNDQKELYRCGYNSYGELGFGDTRPYWKLTKLEIDGITEWRKVALYENTGRCYVLSTDGRLFVSGNGQSYGELGLGTSTTSTTSFIELSVNGVNAWADVFSGRYNAGAITDDGRLFVWGRNHYGQLAQGENNTDNQYSPIQIGTNKTWTMASFGDDRIIALATDGTLWGSGLANDGRLGLGSFYGTKYELTQIGSRTNWKYVHCKSYYNLMISQDNKVYYCGYGSAIFGGGTSGNESVPTYHGYSIGDYQRCDFERILTNDWNDSDVALIQYCKSSSGTFTIPDGVSYISDKAFKDSGYGSYSTIYIPASVETIHATAFSGLYSTNIVFEAPQTEIPSGYPWGHSGGDSYFRYGADFEHTESNEVLNYLISDTFPEDYVFEIPDGVSSIYYKFQNYQSIRTIRIPDVISSLEYAFSGCTNLETVYIGNVDDNSYFYGAFSGCTNLSVIYCDWRKGDKPTMENQAPWGATGASVRYKVPERLQITVTTYGDPTTGTDGVSIETIDGEYFAAGYDDDKTIPYYLSHRTDWCLYPPGDYIDMNATSWVLRPVGSNSSATTLTYVELADGSGEKPHWPIGACRWSGTNGVADVVINISELDDTTTDSTEPTLDEVVL